MHALVVVALLATVTGSGVKKTETRPAEATFAAVESGGFWNVEIVPGDKVAIEVTGDDNIVPLIETKVTGGVLAITTPHTGDHRPKVATVVKLTMPAIERLKLSGAGNALVSDVKTKGLSLDVSGAGNASFKGTADNVTVKSTGAGNLVLTGRAASLDAIAAGAGNVDASAFEVVTAKVKVSGAGNVAVNATGTLDASASGAGNIIHTGGAKVTKKVSGAGSVRAKDGDVAEAPSLAPTPPAKKKKSGGW